MLGAARATGARALVGAERVTASEPDRAVGRRAACEEVGVLERAGASAREARPVLADGVGAFGIGSFLVERVSDLVTRGVVAREGE